MNIAYFNGKFLEKDEISISPDDRGFLFADGIYEVVRWYHTDFYDMGSHLERMNRSLRELRIRWPETDSFPFIARELIKINELDRQSALVYIQITRGAAPRSHNFPAPDVMPTAYAFAFNFTPDIDGINKGINVLLKNEIRWSRCDIKSVSLLPNILSFQEAVEQGCQECIFIRDGIITEGSHSNIFFVKNGILFTHPESDHILSGITRKNVIRIAKEIGIEVIEEAVTDKMIGNISETFLTGTGAEITPIKKLGKWLIGNGQPGSVTKSIIGKFQNEIISLKGL